MSSVSSGGQPAWRGPGSERWHVEAAARGQTREQDLGNPWGSDVGFSRGLEHGCPSCCRPVPSGQHRGVQRTLVVQLCGASLVYVPRSLFALLSANQWGCSGCLCLSQGHNKLKAATVFARCVFQNLKTGLAGKDQDRNNL